MKKLLLSLLVLGIALAVQAATPRYVVSDFINHGTYLVLSNNTAYNWATASNNWFFNYKVGTNVYGSWTSNGGTNYNDPAIVDVPLLPDATGAVNGNLAIMVTLNIYTNWTLPSDMSRWPGNYDTGTNGLFTGGQPLPYAVPTSGSSNVVTFVIAAVPDGNNVATATQNTFTFTFGSLASAGAGGPATIATNLPVSFLQGARTLRVVSMTTDNSPAAKPVIVDRIALVGWVP